MKRIGMLIAALMAVLAFGLPVSAQGGNTWTTEIFDNPYLIGPAKVTRQDSSIALNWGANSPGNGVPADNFSARLATDVNLSAGTYRFFIRADDGVHMYVDFQSVLNTWDNPRPNEVLSVDVTVQNGSHHIQIDYREAIGDAYIYVSWANAATNPTTPNFPVPATPVTTPVTTGSWTGEYFPNVNLTGSASAIVSEASPTHNWAAISPFPSMSADNFSVRWSSTQYLDGSTYQVSVSADDGIRVYVDNVITIDQWHDASAQTYTALLNLAAGNHTFRVEYYEASGLAFVNFQLAKVTAQQQQPGATTPRIVVTTGALNVRNAPDAVNGVILTRIRRGETYEVLGRNSSGSWLQINAAGITGWVNANYVSASNIQNVPVVGAVTPTPTPAPTTPSGYTLSTTGNLNMRLGPSTSQAIVGRIPNGNTARIIARTADNSWWKVEYNNGIGWVNAGFVILQAGINFSAVPVASA